MRSLRAQLGPSHTSWSTRVSSKLTHWWSNPQDLDHFANQATLYIKQVSNFFPSISFVVQLKSQNLNVRGILKNTSANGHYLLAQIFTKNTFIIKSLSHQHHRVSTASTFHAYIIFTAKTNKKFLTGCIITFAYDTLIQKTRHSDQHQCNYFSFIFALHSS